MTENQFRSHFSPFRSMRKFPFFLNICSQNGCRRPFWMTENHIRFHFSPFQMNTLFFLNFCSQNGCRRAFWMTENHFRSYFSPFQIYRQLFFKTFLHKMAAGGHFGRSKITQINMQLLFFIFFKMAAGYLFLQNGRRRPFWMIENHFRSHFSPFQINTQLFLLIFFSKWPPAAILEVRFAPKTTGFFHYVLSITMPNMKLIGEFMTKLETPQTC